MNVKLNLDEKKILQKTNNDKLGLFVSQTWKRLIDPYTPRKTGQLMGVKGQTVDIKPWRLHYKMPYAQAVYYNPRGVKFIQSGTGRNPYATDHWDEKAAQAGQKEKLIKTINTALRMGKI